MPKLDPYTLPRPRREARSKTFTYDSADHPLTLTLRRLSFGDDAAAEEEVRELREIYLTGNDVRGAAPFPDPDVTPSVTLFRTAARIRRMQCPDDPDAYSTMDLLLLSARQPRNYEALVIWADEIDKGAEQSLGELPSPPTEA